MSHPLKNEPNQDDPQQREKPEPISFDEFAADPGRVFDDAARSIRGVTVERAGELYRVLRLHRRRAEREHHPLTADDPFWEIAGIGRSGEPGNDVAANKYKYLADAYADTHEPQEPHEGAQTGQPDTPPSAASADASNVSQPEDA